jgi:hypothetical protein
MGTSSICFPILKKAEKGYSKQKAKLGMEANT